MLSLRYWNWPASCPSRNWSQNNQNVSNKKRVTAGEVDTWGKELGNCTHQWTSHRSSSIAEYSFLVLFQSECVCNWNVWLRDTIIQHTASTWKYSWNVLNRFNMDRFLGIFTGLGHQGNRDRKRGFEAKATVHTANSLRAFTFSFLFNSFFFFAHGPSLAFNLVTRCQLAH